MLDLFTAGTLASLPLSIQTPLFARLRAATRDGRATTGVGRTASRIRADAAGLTCCVEPLTCSVEPDIRLRTWLTEALDDPTHAATMLDAARAAADRALSRAARDGIEALPWGARDYPPLLARIADPPPLLWVRGAASLLSLPAVAVVGSRAASSYGLEVARDFGAGLAETGVLVVSGLARGVDSSAHRGALSRGATAAILGSGADVIYPKEHAALAAEIVARGVLVSELPPGAAPRRHHFPRRNRLISGLSLAVVVVEASTRSGSLQTARLALEQGREVMAVPGTILGDRNRGCHGLLRDGAALVETAADVLDELRLPWRLVDDPSGRTAGTEDRTPDGLSPLDGGEAFDFQQLMAMTNLSAGELLRQLLRGEMTGRVVRTGHGRFLRAGRPVVR
jgi:DNA processing protein